MGWKDRAGRQNGGEKVIDYECPVLKVSGAFPLIYSMEEPAVSMGSWSSDDGDSSRDFFPDFCCLGRNSSLSHEVLLTQTRLQLLHGEAHLTENNTESQDS